MEEPETSKKDDLALYRKMMQDKIREELEKLQKAEEDFKIKIQEQNKRKKEREEMKKKVLGEIEAIKVLEIQKTAELERHEEERKKRELKEQEERERRKREEEEREKERQRFAEELAEARRLSEEARKASERRERLRLEAEQHKRESEEARRKAFEAERLRLMALEEEERQVKLGEQKKAREEEERRFAQAVLERRKNDVEREKKAREEMDAERLRDQEEMRLQMLESKKRKFEREEEERRKREEEEREKMSQPRRKKTLNDNPLLMRFEEISQQQKKQEEELLASKTRQKKPHPAKFSKKIEAKTEALRQSKLAVSAALSKGTLNNVRYSSKELIKAVSKELLKVLSKDSLKSKSRSNIFSSKDALKRVGSVKNLNPGSRSNSRCELSSNLPTKKDMQSYLISHVLFDGKEEVQLSKHGKGSQRHLANVREEQTLDTPVIQISTFNEESEDRLFEAYKQEMEKYLSCFDGEDSNKKLKKYKKSKKKEVPVVELDKKPILNIGTIRNQFESLASPEAIECDEPPKLRPKKVGKLDTVKLFEGKSEIENKKKEYVPVVIDKDAFERTMGRFEHYKDEEEEREKRREENRKRKLEEERMRMEREKEEMERRLKEEEEAKKRIKEEEERAIQEEREKKKASMLTKIGNFFTGKGNDPKETKEESPVKEIDPAEQARLRRMDIQTRIQHELEKIRILEEKQKIQSERERKKQEMKRLIQMELDKIKGLDVNQKSQEEEDMPLWMKMVYDPEARKRYTESKNQRPGENRDKPVEIEQSRIAEALEEGTPKWVQMVNERQEALQRAKAQMEEAFSKENKNNDNESDLQKMKTSLLDLTKVCKDSFKKDSILDLKNDHSETVKETDSRPPMTFEESVQAMIDLLEDDKKWAESHKKDKSKLMSQKKENVILPNVSAVRNQFENMETSPGQPTSPLIPCEINQDKVKQAKMQLLQQKDKDSNSGQSKMDILLTKKCSSIKSMFERSNSTTDDKDDQQVKPKPKKQIVQVMQTSSIDEQLAEKKRQMASENKWKYKEKSLRDLHHIFSNNNTTTQLAQKVESVLETSKRVADEEAKRLTDKQQDLDDYNVLMDQIHQFVNEKDCMGKTDEEISFQNTLTGYLQLIEEDNEFRKNQAGTKTVTQKSKKEAKKAPKKISTDIFKTEEQLCDQNKSKNVKKLDMSRFNQSVEKSADQAVTRREAPSSYNCDSIKEYLEKKTGPQQTESLSHIQRKMKLINVENPLSVGQSLAELKAKREQQWTWKQKTIGELQDFLSKNQTLAKNLVENTTAKDLETANRKEALENMLAKRRQLQQATQQRDEEFDKFLDDLEQFSQLPVTDKSDEIFKSSVKSYLQLIDTQKREDEEEITLPEITLPSRLEDLKNRITDRDNEQVKLASKKPMTIKKIPSFFGKAENQNKDYSSQEKEAAAQTLSPGKATKLKKMFEEKPKISSMMRTRSELTLGPAKKPKQLIDQAPVQLPMLSRRNSVKTSWSNRVSSYFSSSQPEKDPAYKALEQRLDSQGAKSKWDDISDPEERKRAILAKHGFKPHTDSGAKTTSNIDDVDTIPEHILKDEVLYRKYMKQQISMEDSSGDSSRDSSPERRDPKGGSFSSLMNILSAMKKTSMQKSAMDSRKKLDSISKQTHRSKSEIDLSAVPGSCSNIKSMFESNDNRYSDRQPDREELQEVSRSTSCSNLRSLWETHMSQTDANHNNNNDRPCPQPLNIEAFKESLMHSSSASNSHVKEFIETGELSSEAFKYFKESLYKQEGSTSVRPRPQNSSAIAALRESLAATSSSGTSGGNRAKELFESGAFTSKAIRQFTEQRSVVGKSEDEKYDFERQKRRLFSKLNQNQNTSNEDEDQAHGIRSELEALRSSGQVKGLFRLERGREDSNRGSRLMQRSMSSSNFEMSGLGPTPSADLDEDTMAELSVSNSMIRAMFESSAPKYKFGGGGGSNENVTTSKKDDTPLRPVMRPSQKTKEERKWVLDTINKYFDVIVEEEDEEKEEEDEQSNLNESLDSSAESLYESDLEDDLENSGSDNDDHAGGQSNFVSTARIRGILETVVNKVITNSQTNLAVCGQNGKQKRLMGQLKENLGSQISLKRQMSFDQGLNFA